MLLHLKDVEMLNSLNGKAGVGIYHFKGGRKFMAYSVNLLQAVIRHLDDLESVELHVGLTVDDIRSARPDVPGKRSKYSIHCELREHYSRKGKFLAYVELKAKHKGKKVVGVFEKMWEADQFIQQYYSGQTIETLIECTNAETKKYKRFKKNQLDI